MRVILINPPAVAVKGDVAGTAAVYWPITLAYLYEIIKDKYETVVLDMFGIDPTNTMTDGNVIKFGMPINNLKFSVKGGDVVVLYSGSVVAHRQNLKLIKVLNSIGVSRVIVVENPNFVNACPLDLFYDDYASLGAVVIPGYPFDVIDDAIGGTYVYNGRVSCDSLDSLAFPRWDAFPLDNYWSLNYAHAPKTNDKYIQIYTSWGCPNSCVFCTASHLSSGVWVGRSAESVVEEMKFWNYHGVFEFHIEDLNPTVDRNRIKEICRLMDEYKVRAEIKIAAGTRIGDIDEDLIIDMANHGLTYLSFSPESGYWKTLHNMGKTFDHDHALNILDVIHDKKKIRGKVVTQACFVLGFPVYGEVEYSWNLFYIAKLVKHGVDEIALFKFAPSPGTIFWDPSVDCEHINFGIGDGSKDIVNKNRMTCLMFFIVAKMIKTPLRTIFRFPKTKAYMTLRRFGFKSFSGV